MSDFSLSSDRRRRLLQGNYSPLVFEGWTDDVYDPKPHGCEPGARYVLSWQAASVTLVKDDRGEVVDVIHNPRLPVWYITVKKCQRRTEGGWLVKFDVTDLRDRDLYLRRGAGYQTTRKAAVDELPMKADPETTERARAIWREQALLRKEQLDRDRRRRSQAQRLQEVKRRARLSGVDISTDERVIEERIERMERKVDREPNGDVEAA